MHAVSLEEVILIKEKTKINGIIIKSRSKEFVVLSDGKEYVCSARGNLKIKDKKLVTGDRVVFENNIITQILDRTNEIGRPKVVNCDIVNIVIASTPAPDFLLIDKMIVECVRQGIEVYLTVNKSDISKDLADYVLANYSKAVDKIFIVSAQNNQGIDQIVQSIHGKLCCLAGQSAVGKTSICNAIFGNDDRVNTLSRKTDRGRHTTTSRTIHYKDDLLIIDTPGFSSLDLQTVSSYNLMEFYKDFEPYNGKCFFIGCMHINEPDCQVKNALNAGEISQDRYSRYITIYKEIKEYERRKY